MGKLRVEAGSIKETVTQERIIPDESASDDQPRDVIEYMDSVPDEERREYLGYIYRLAPEKSDGHIGKFEIPFDLDFVRENFGGGEYKIWVKKGSHIKRTSTYKIIGAPKSDVPMTTARSVGSSDTRSEIVQLFEQWQKNNPQTMSIEILKKSFDNAMDIQRNAASNSVMKPSEMFDMMIKFHQMSTPAASAVTAENPLLKDFFAALIPVGVALITQLVTPKNPITAITEISGAFQAMKQLGDGGSLGGPSAKPDIMALVVDRLPSLVSAGTQFLAEMRAATQLQIQTRALEQSRTMPVVSANPALHTPPAAPVVHAAAPQPNPAAHVVAQTPVNDGAPTPEWILNRVRALIEQGENAGFIYSFLDEHLPDLINNLHQAAAMGVTAETIREGILKDEVVGPILGPAMKSPHWEKFFADFFALLHEKRPDAPPAVPIN